MPVVVTFEFDPAVRIAGLVVRWETVGVGASVLIALLAAALIARASRPTPDGRGLHLDDLLYLAVGAVPGAVVGGRIGYALVHLDYYSSHAGAILDPAQGGFELALAVGGGLLTSLYVALVLEAPVGRWAHAAALPLLLAIEGGKAAMAWGGSGQGGLTTGPVATAYLGPGPWGSLAADLPSHPSQLYEAALAAAIGILLLVVIAAGGFARRDGRLLLVGYGLWLAGRTGIATTWRDPVTVGVLRADQVVSLGLLAATLLAIAVVGRGRRLLPRHSGRSPAWPDPTAAEAWRTSSTTRR